MKEISTTIMSWVTYIGGMDVVWVGIVSIVGTQLATILGVSNKHVLLFRLMPYLTGAIGGCVLLSPDIKGVFIGGAIGMLASGARYGLILWLEREASKPWMKKLAGYITGNVSQS